MTDGWIVVPNWHRFQHYRDRQPVWIKVYTELEHSEAWLQLSLSEKGLLVLCWILYAQFEGVLRTSEVQARVRHRVKRGTWDSLVDAGFIEVSASKPLALARAGARSREKETERDTPPTPPAGGAANNTRKTPARIDARGYTGCRRTRGSHGVGFARDVLGRDTPPQDWPHDKPSRAEVLAALEQRDRT